MIGLSNVLAREETLMKNDYFGQFGRISKVVVYKNSTFNGKHNYSPSLSAYLTFSDEKEASLAIFAVDGLEIQEKILHCSYGTTKFFNKWFFKGFNNDFEKVLQLFFKRSTMP